MESLPRFAQRAGAAVIAALLVGCASGPVASAPPVLAPPVVTGVIVQSIPRGAWIEVDGGYKGMAPILVGVEVNSLGKPRRVVRIRATDVESGAFEEKAFYGARMPDKVLFDLRPWIRRPEVLTF